MSAGRRGRRLRALAVATLLPFGCATYHRAGEQAPAVRVKRVRVALAEPELELWMEGTRPIDPAESARALEDARDALSHALLSRGLDDPEPEALLVVHARAVARTDERRSAQAWSIVAVVVVVVALVVIALASKSRGPSGSTHLARPAPAPNRPPGVPYRLRRGPPAPSFGFGLEVGVVVPEEEPSPYLEPEEAFLARRGWFDGDETELSVELVDRTTGELVGHREAKGALDPRDENALRSLVDRALRSLPLETRAGSDELAPPPPPPP